ncbi:TrmH family RNA methyltransferase [Candidatus Latescibacterota bacterium]
MKNDNSPLHLPTEEINSSSNNSFKIWRSLVNARGIKKNKLAIVSGEKIINELFKNKKDIIRNVILSSNEKSSRFDNFTILSELTELSNIKFIKLKNDLFREIDILGTKNPLLIVEIPEYESYDPATFNENVLPILPFQDPVNVGAVVRTAAAFGIRKIMLLKEAAIPYHPKSIRASAAQVFNMDFIDGPSINKIENMGIPLVTLSAAGKNIKDFEFPEKYALLAGIEGPGIPDNLNPDFTVSIKMQPYVESLNAAISVSIALYEWRKRNPL